VRGQFHDLARAADVERQPEAGMFFDHPLNRLAKRQFGALLQRQPENAFKSLCLCRHTV
jgi:hypothetical protein